MQATHYRDYREGTSNMTSIYTAPTGQNRAFILRRHLFVLLRIARRRHESGYPEEKDRWSLAARKIADALHATEVSQ